MRPCHLALALLFSSGCGGGAPASEPVSHPADPGVAEATAAEAPERAPEADLTCHPYARCLCWEGCALLRVGPDGAVRLDSEGDERFAPGPEGHEACDAEGRCGPGFDSVTAACDETCAPSRAPFTCRRDPTQPIDATGRPCVRVE